MLKDAGIRQVAMVPDAGHSRLIRSFEADPETRVVTLTTEEEGVAMLAGAWLGGERGVLLLQSSGVGNCINMILAPLRTMRVSFIRASQKSSGCSVSGPGLKPRNAFSNPGHLVSITLQAKPAENTRLVISARIRSSPSLASAFKSGFGGSRRASALGPPLRFSARARMVLNGVTAAALLVK